MEHGYDGECGVRFADCLPIHPHDAQHCAHERLRKKKRERERETYIWRARENEKKMERRKRNRQRERKREREDTRAYDAWGWRDAHRTT